jgi:hypothetical protein
MCREKVLWGKEEIAVLGFISDKQQRPVLHFVRLNESPKLEAIQFSDAMEKFISNDPKQFVEHDSD